MFVARSGTCLALLVLLAAARHGLGAPPGTLRPHVAPQVQLDVVLAEVRSPIRDLKAASRPLTRPGQFPFASLLHSSSEVEHYLRYLQRIERRERGDFILAQPRLVGRSGQPMRFLGRSERGCLPPPDFHGSFGVQFEELGAQLSFLPVLLQDGIVRIDIETELTINGTNLDRRACRSVELRPGQTLILAAPDGWRHVLVLVTPSAIREADNASPISHVMNATFADTARQSLRSLEWRFHFVQAEIAALWKRAAGR